ncbi:Uncharacterised protein [Bordetella pertussis]|nr:Uncharacterised protein [Bordetella pertussis]
MRKRAARACAAFSASSTVCPSSYRISDSSSRMPTSSSTTRILAITSHLLRSRIILFLRGRVHSIGRQSQAGQQYGDPRAPFLAIGEIDAAAMFFNDLAHNG